MQRTTPKNLIFGSLLSGTIGVCCMIKYIVSGKKYKGREKLNDKIAIVTGANTGIGKEVALSLAARSAQVVLACRDLKKCEKACKEIIHITKNKHVFCRECNLASQESIRKFVVQFKKEFPKLHILVNNAGIMRCPKSFTKEGIEMQFGVNHIGHFLLTNLLLDVIKNSAPARIINLSSSAHMKGKIKLEDLNSTEKYDPHEAYAQSKLANILFTKELAKRLEATKVVVNAVHPGLVNTEIVRHMRVFNNFFTGLFLKPFMWLFAKTPEEGAQTVLYVALDPSLENITGCYFSDCELTAVSNEAKDEKLAKWLWAVSEKWTKLNTT